MVKQRGERRPDAVPVRPGLLAVGGCGAAAAALLAALLGGCAAPRQTLAEQQEAFDAPATYTRSYAAPGAQTCEAARRALLSQGYVIGTAGAETVQGRKNFQPKGDVHVEVDLRVVCAPDGAGHAGSIAFVNALQDRYALKKSANSASVGVGALGSLSLPLPASDDSLVRVASETITAAAFYDRFFALIERYLPTVAVPQTAASQPAAAASPPAATAPQPPAAAPSSPAATPGNGDPPAASTGTTPKPPVRDDSVAPAPTPPDDTTALRAPPDSPPVERHATIRPAETPAPRPA